MHALLPRFERHGIEAVAVGLLHSYANPAHERRVGEILAAALPELRITLSSEVCPEIREYERQSTACANAYVQPRMSGYLTRLESELRVARPRLPAAPHDLRRRPHHPRERDPLSHPARRVGPGRRRDPRHGDRPRVRLATTRSPSTWAGRRPRSASSTASSPRRPARSRWPAPTATSRGAACRSASRPSRWWRSGPAAGPSRGWTRWAGSTSVRRARAPTRAPPATTGAASGRR